MRGDILARVELLRTSDGGRRGRTPDTFLSCRIRSEKNTHDCRLIMGPEGAMVPGDSAEKEVKFLNREAALKDIKVGEKLALLEFGEIGTITVLRLF